jgi:hypothetical protein
MLSQVPIQQPLRAHKLCPHTRSDACATTNTLSSNHPHTRCMHHTRARCYTVSSHIEPTLRAHFVARMPSHLLSVLRAPHTYPTMLPPLATRHHCTACPPRHHCTASPRRPCASLACPLHAALITQPFASPPPLPPSLPFYFPAHHHERRTHRVSRRTPRVSGRVV